LTNRPATLADYLAILRRRAWIVIALPVLAASTAYALSTRQTPSYEASALVYINTSPVAGLLQGVSPSTDPGHLLANQATLARSEKLAQRVVDAAGLPGVSAGAFLAQSSVAPRGDTDFLDLTVSSANPRVAVDLVNAYAEQYARYKNQFDTGNVDKALRAIQDQIRLYRAQGNTGSPEYDDAVGARATLQRFRFLARNASVEDTAQGAAKVSPLPRRNAILGGLLGLLLGIGAALLAEALDRRVRSEEEIGEALELPLLGRLPRPSRRLRRANELVMLADPRSVHAETLRKLRTSLEFVNFERGAKTIMVTSAGPREGKSTTVANLAVAFARAGRSVALVDLDLRRPFVHTFFNVNGNYGITDVVVERMDLDQAIRPVALPSGSVRAKHQVGNGRPSGASNGQADAEGVLHLLPSGTIPPAADEFLESERVSLVLDELAGKFDVVLVDAPPLLAVGDAQTLSAKVDAIVVVARLGIHQRQLQEFARQLRNCRAAILGFVLTGVSHGDSYSYGYGYDPHVYDARQETGRRGERV
jgi:Mrp family chromosome partitioning ATPase/capsular polysaccharide biosynthesis protein